MTKISDFSALTGASVDAANDLITVADMSETGVDRNKKMTFAELKTAIGAYMPAGTDVALADGGTGASLVDPGADRVLFWDDSAGAVTWLELGTGLSITGTTLNASATTPTECIILAVSDETTALTTGTAKLTFRMPYAFTLTGVRASVTTAPTGATLTVDINEGGSTILSTKLTIDASEKTSQTAAAAAVISDTALADDAEITIDIDQIGSTIAGAGLKVTLIGHQ